jgi:hypothetical protein
MIRSACISLLLHASICVAQGMNEAKIEGQPLQYIKEGAVNGCGVRLFSFELNQDLMTGQGWDGSINVWASGVANVKGLTYDLNIKEMESGKRPKHGEIEKFWLKAPGSRATTPRDGKIFPGEDAGSILYVTEIDVALALFDAVFQDKSITVGLRRKGERSDRLYFGRAKLSDAERQQLILCMGEVSR